MNTCDVLNSDYRPISCTQLFLLQIRFFLLLVSINFDNINISLHIKYLERFTEQKNTFLLSKQVSSLWMSDAQRVKRV